MDMSRRMRGAQGPNERADAAALVAEPERQRNATRGAHATSAPDRRRHSPTRRDSGPCRLRTVPVKSPASPRLPAPRRHRSPRQTSYEIQHRQMLGVAGRAGGQLGPDVRPPPHWTAAAKTRVALVKAPGPNCEHACREGSAGRRREMTPARVAAGGTSAACWRVGKADRPRAFGASLLA